MLRTNKQKELIDRERELSATSYFFLCCPSIAPLSDRAIAKSKISGHTQQIREGEKESKSRSKYQEYRNFKTENTVLQLTLRWPCVELRIFRAPSAPLPKPGPGLLQQMRKHIGLYVIRVRSGWSIRGSFAVGPMPVTPHCHVVMEVVIHIQSVRVRTQVQRD